MTNLGPHLDLDGSLDRRVDYTAWILPSGVEVRDDELVWWHDYPSKSTPWKYKAPGARFFEEFLGLADADSKRIASYARQWGVLNICEEHELPYTHNPQPYPWPPYGTALHRPCSPKGRPPSGPCSEPIAVWKHFSRQMRALLAIAAELREGREGRPSDWDVVYEVAEPSQRPFGSGWAKKDRRIGDADVLDIQRFQLGLIVDEHLSFSGLRPRFEWKYSSSPRFSPLSGNMFGALSIQLALTIQAPRGLALCSECGAIYAPNIRTRPNVDHYCPTCRSLGAPQRNAKRRSRRRRSEAAGSAVPTPKSD
jgi:hypothetical protein